MQRSSSVAAARLIAARLARLPQRGSEAAQIPLLWHATLGRPTHDPLNIERKFSTVGADHVDAIPEADELPQESAQATNLDDGRTAILTEALHHVHEHGWSKDALAAGVVSAGLPPATIGLVSGGRTDLVEFFMNRCNDELRDVLRRRHRSAWEADRTPVPVRLEQALRARLGMVMPFVRIGRWHEGMALGVSSPSVAAVTAGQLDSMAAIVADAVGLSSSEAFGVPGRAAIVSAYAAAELHLLADSSPGREETWAFLRQRVGDLEAAAGVASKGPAGLALNPDTFVFASAVATSLGGAALSLARPAATGAVSAIASTIVPQIMTFMQPQQSTTRTGASFNGSHSRGTKASDYDLDDLPPFEATTSPSVDTK